MRNAMNVLTDTDDSLKKFHDVKYFKPFYRLFYLKNLILFFKKLKRKRILNPFDEMLSLVETDEVDLFDPNTFIIQGDMIVPNVNLDQLESKKKRYFSVFFFCKKKFNRINRFKTKMKKKTKNYHKHSIR